MDTRGYNLIAALSVACGTALGVAAIVSHSATVDVVALVAPFLALAGTIAGRGSGSDT